MKTDIELLADRLQAVSDHVDSLLEAYWIHDGKLDALEDAIRQGGAARGTGSFRFTHSPNIRITVRAGGSPDDESTWEKVTLRRGDAGDITVPYTKDGLAALISVREGLFADRKAGSGGR
jgi:hypothetical protein